MIKYNYKKLTLAVAISLAISGCAVYGEKSDVDDLSKGYGVTTTQQVNSTVESATVDAKKAAQIVNRPYLAGKARPVARDISLPLVLQGKVDTTMLYADDADLLTLANRITEASGVPVKVMPDALLPLSAFMPRLDEKGKSPTDMLAPSPTTAFVLPPELDELLMNDGIPRDSGPRAPSAITKNKKSAEKQPKAQGKQFLAQVLDGISLRLNVYWKYDDQIGAIIFFRTETRTFEIRNAELSPSLKMSVGIAGSVDGKSSNALTSTSLSTIDLKEDKESPLESVIKRMTQYMTVSGKLASGSGGLVVVTDTKTALDDITAYVKEENRMRTRRIDLVFEEITLENNNSTQGAVNWNLMFSSNGSGNGVDINGLNSLMEKEGAALNLGASVGSGQFQGSSIALQALSKVGKVVDKKMNAFGAINGQPATVGRPERQKYIDKLDQTPGYSDNSKPTVTVTQGEEVFGRIMTVVPRAYADGSIDIALKYDNTPEPDYEKQVFSDGGYVQSPKTASDVLVRTAILKSGQPYIVNAFTTDSSSYAATRVDPNAPIIAGGSDKTAKNSKVTVLVLTARVRE